MIQPLNTIEHFIYLFIYFVFWSVHLQFDFHFQGPRSVAVPAVLKGLKEAHETYGT